MMKRLLALFLLISLPARAGEALHLYTWDTYLAPELFRAFEKETGIKIVTDVFSNGDQLVAKLKSGGAYDIVTPSGNYIPQLAAEGLLRKLPKDLRAIGATLARDVRAPAYDAAHTHSLPLFYGTTALAVNTKLTPENITSWNQYFRRPAGEAPRLGVLDEVASVMNLASLPLNIPFCDDRPDSYKALQALLLEQKPFVKIYGATGYTERMAAGETTLQMAWNGDVYRARQQNPALKYVYPKEGVELWVDNLAIPAAAKNPKAAERFIAFATRPDNLVAYAVAAGMIPSVTEAQTKLPQAMKEAPEFNIPPGTIVKMAQACPANVLQNQAKIWSRLTR